MTPSHSFALLASITMRAIVMDSEMNKRSASGQFEMHGKAVSVIETDHAAFGLFIRS
jgi:hypothetical protein